MEDRREMNRKFKEKKKVCEFLLLHFVDKRRHFHDIITSDSDVRNKII